MFCRGRFIIVFIFCGFLVVKLTLLEDQKFEIKSKTLRERYVDSYFWSEDWMQFQLLDELESGDKQNLSWALNHLMKVLTSPFKTPCQRIIVLGKVWNGFVLMIIMRMSFLGGIYSRPDDFDKADRSSFGYNERLHICLDDVIQEDGSKCRVMVVGEVDNYLTTAINIFGTHLTSYMSG